MPVKHYTASADNTITNAYKVSSYGTTKTNTRGTGSNTGVADVVEVFSSYGAFSSGSQELSRILIDFPVATISSDRTAGKIPASGSVNFFMRLRNAKHAHTVPEDFTLVILPVAQSWQEGTGLDLVGHQDDTKGIPGSNWMSASNTTPWTGSNYTTLDSVGGSYRTGSSDPQFKQTFKTGLEDLEVDVTPLVEHWIAGTIDSNGVGVHLTSSQEAYYANDGGVYSGSALPLSSGATYSYYTKRFFARTTEFFYRRPHIEARWDDTTRDDRGSFYYSSSLAPAADNLNTIYLYNYVRGRLTNIPDLGSDNRVYVSIFSGSTDNSEPSGSALILVADNSGYVRSAAPTIVTGGQVSTGIYSASFAITAAATAVKTLYDIWFTGSDVTVAASSSTATRYSTGSIAPSTLVGGGAARDPVYYINITNLKNRYNVNENARFNLYVRNKYWNPTIYTKANSSVSTTNIVSASYSIIRLMDAFVALPYGTGSILSTGLSYDVSGNYFDLDMSVLEAGYGYGIKFAFYDPELTSWIEQDRIFKFRVEEYEY
ncbi:hypothetical protein CMI47_06330 [Candidatus Pacearchaeota archaeon]|nr:hypothetical protein [Candidatus Pacearchaeota archaeon]